MDEVILASAPKRKSPPKLSYYRLQTPKKKIYKHTCRSCLRKFPLITCDSCTLCTSASTDGWHSPISTQFCPLPKKFVKRMTVWHPIRCLGTYFCPTKIHAEKPSFAQRIRVSCLTILCIRAWRSKTRKKHAVCFTTLLYCGSFIENGEVKSAKRRVGVLAK